MQPLPRRRGRLRQVTTRTVRQMIWIAVAILATACSGNRPIQPWADLQISGVKKIPGIEALQKNSDVDRVYHAVTYQSKLDGNATHVLFENGQAVYDMRLDGSQLHIVKLPCSESVAVAPGGQWVACRTNSDIVLHDLTTYHANITLSDAGQYPGYPTWAPDGHHLAVMTSLGGGCSVGIYDVSFAAGSTHLVALLSLPRFVTQESNGTGCSAKRLTWSPDGTQFAFIDIDLRTLYDLPIGSLHVLTGPDTLPPITQVMIGDQLIQLGKCSSTSGLAWSTSSKTLTFVDFDGRNIEQVDIATHDTTTTIAQRVAEIFDLSWVPDGKHLLFVLGRASDVLTAPPSQLYVYTPSGT